MKKKIITIAGGLGNQMLQYAKYIEISIELKNNILYLKPDSINDHHNINIDEIFFDIKIMKNSFFLNIVLHIDEKTNRIINFLNRLFKTTLFSTIKKINPYEIVNFPQFNSYIFNKKISLSEIFIFPDICSQKNIDLLQLIETKNSVSIHVRRGDYVNDISWRSILGDICNIEYYNNALKIINDNVTNPFFIIFSDDIEWCLNHFEIKNVVYVDWNNDKNSYIDMQLMSKCKNNIICNSTFSLMAAILNSNKSKIIICPSKWRNIHNDLTYLKFVDKNWTVLNNNKPNISIIIDFDIDFKSIKYILKQSYSDFELLLLENQLFKVSDDRIKYNSNAIGNFIFSLQRSELINFKNRNHLKYLLTKYLSIHNESYLHIK